MALMKMLQSMRRTLILRDLRSLILLVDCSLNPMEDGFMRLTITVSSQTNSQMDWQRLWLPYIADQRRKLNSKQRKFREPKTRSLPMKRREDKLPRLQLQRRRVANKLRRPKKINVFRKRKKKRRKKSLTTSRRKSWICSWQRSSGKLCRRRSEDPSFSDLLISSTSISLRLGTHGTRDKVLLIFCKEALTCQRTCAFTASMCA